MLYASSNLFLLALDTISILFMLSLFKFERE